MQELIQHIVYLLRRHDCVTVPGIGAFIATVRSASTAVDGLIVPPARVLAFNAAIDHNDGLLTASYARRMRCGAAKASAALAADIELLRAALDADAVVELPGYGSLNRADGRINFVASDTTGWLPVLKLHDIMQMARDDSGNVRSGDTVRVDRVSGYMNKLRIAASIAVVLALGFVLSTPTPIDNAQFASPAVEQFRPKMPQTSHLLRQPGSQSGALQINSVADASAVMTADTAAIAAYKVQMLNRAAELKQTAATPPAQPGRYCLVIASLNSGADAGKFLKANSDMQLHVLEKDGRYRVYAMSGASIEQVRGDAAAAGLFERFPGAWICRR